jgi:hypothetical protein
MFIMVILVTENETNLTLPEFVFLVMLGKSSLLARHEVYGKTTENLAPSWERARTQHD